MARTLLCVLVLFSLTMVGCDESVDQTPPETEPIEGEIIGKWKINVPRSVELSKTNPKVKPEDHEKLSAMIEKMAEKVQMEITDSQINAGIGNRTRTLTYKIDSTDKDAKTVTLSIDDAEGVTVVCKIIEDKYLNQVSSATDDMNYFIWEPVKETSIAE